MGQSFAEIAPLYEYRSAGEAYFSPARHYHPGFRVRTRRSPSLPFFCLFHIGEILAAGVTEEAAGIVWTLASGADDFAFGVRFQRGKRQPAFIAHAVIGAVFCLACPAYNFGSFYHYSGLSMVLIAVYPI